ncbi:unnamed protein product [Lepeophtheirus salmonis]|uniref:(salmon louse) hypothetical protein n=1 Tax=Lepeophtheirus salmonis TaxID=72036 RepID=A0A7R8H9E0_LEPSM|nr:unnamed protein product [Lepeophtheirus salmonis]CAF2954943.1 unnamed protein product [Lepeophtheirus salmonis]
MVNYCSVPGYKDVVGFRFPKKVKLSVTINLINLNTNNLLAPSLYSIVCHEYFKKGDYDLTGGWDTGVPRHMPKDFKTKFPATRLVLDATEIAIENPKNVTQQVSSSSSYKNYITVKERVRFDIFFIEFCFSTYVRTFNLYQRTVHYNVAMSLF